MTALERIAVLLTLAERLKSTMASENRCVRQMQIDRLASLHDEKQTLAEAYERELHGLRREAEALGQLPIEARRTLEDAMRELQTAGRKNAELLLAAKIVVERLLKHLADSLTERSPGGYPVHRHSQVIPVSFNRTV